MRQFLFLLCCCSSLTSSVFAAEEAKTFYSIENKGELNSYSSIPLAESSVKKDQMLINTGSLIASEIKIETPVLLNKGMTSAEIIKK